MTRAERLVLAERADDATFELAVQSGNGKAELVVDRAGKIIKEKIKRR